MPHPKTKAVSFKAIGDRVRALRERAELTQTQLARKLRSSQAAVSEVERGRRGLTIHQVVRLAKTLNVTPNEILGEGKRERASARPKNPKVRRRMYRIEQLPEPQQQVVLKLLDSIIEAHGRAS